MITQNRRNGSKLDELKNMDSVNQILNFQNVSTNNSHMFKNNLQKNSSKKNLSLKLKKMDKKNSKIEYNRDQKNPFLADKNI